MKPALSTSASPSTSARGSSVSVAIVDPSCFSWGYDYSLCNALVRQGCQVLLVCCKFRHAGCDHRISFPVWNEFYRHTHASAHYRLPGWARRFAKAAEHVFSMCRFLDLLHETRPHVIHFEWLTVPLLDKAFLPALSRLAPLVLTIHNTTWFHRSGGFGLQGVGFKSALKHFSAAIVHTEYSKDRVLKRSWFSEDKVYVIPMGAYDHYQELGDQTVGPTSGEQSVLFLGAISRYKGIDILLRAFAQIPDEMRRVTTLVIAGMPDKHLNILRHLALDLGIEDRITWKLGFLTEAEVATQLRRADIVALPYREVDQSGALFTAIGMGKPIVATRVGGLPEVIRNGTHGYLVEPADVVGLSAALNRALCECDRTKQMGRAVTALRDKFTWDKTASETIAVYHRLLGRSALVRRNERMHELA